MHGLPFQQTSTHNSFKRIYIPKKIENAKYVFVRFDSVKKLLQQSYKGLYKVLLKTNTFYILLIHGQEESVSVDCLKPAFVQDEKKIGQKTSTSLTIEESQTSDKRKTRIDTCTFCC